MARIGTIVESDLGFFSGAIINTILGSIPVVDVVATIPTRYLWSSPTGSAPIPYVGGPQDVPFTQAIVADTMMWNTVIPTLGFPTASLQPAFIDDYGIQTDVHSANAMTGSNQLHYFAPPAGTISAAGSATAGQLVPATVYTYAITLVAANVNSAGAGILGVGQETSPLRLNPLAPGGADTSITLTVTPGAAGHFNAFSGVFPHDPTAAYTTNIYRSSTTQPVFFLVNTTPVTGLTFTDTFSDAAISSHAQLTENRDPAPVKADYDFLGTIGITSLPPETSGNDTPFHTYFQGAPMEYHEGRMWYFAMVQNSDTENSGQFQLWYSNLNRAWEFDKVDNVFEVDLPRAPWPTMPGPVDSATTVHAASINPYLYPSNMYIEMPSAMKSINSVLVFWTTQRMYVMYGTDPSTFLFRKLADIGCSSRRSVAYAAAENSIVVFWMSENGIYATDGGTISYISEDIRHIISNLSPQDRYNCVGFYADHTYYISFPTLNQTWGYRTTNSQWHGPLAYSTVSAFTVAADPILGNVALPGPFNEVLAVRPNTMFVDSWFAETDADLGLPITVQYNSDDQPTQNPHIEKEYTHIAITHKVQVVPCSVTVTVTVDDDPTKTAQVTFDMTLGPTQIATISYEGIGGGPLRGFLAALTIEFTTVVPNPTAPIQIKSVAAYGKYMSRNLTPTVNMGNP